MKITFWGVRGSTPLSGASVLRYGGHTSCVEVTGPEAPSLVFDCGTGARDLGRSLVERGATDITVLFSHTHMDHLFALPFFGPINQPGCKVTLGVPASNNVEAKNKIGRYLNGVFHPLRIDDLEADVHFQAIDPGTCFDVGPYRVQTLRLAHPGGTLGYRVVHGEHSVCYLTDTGPLALPDEGLMAEQPASQREAELVALLQGADLMIMDTTFTREEYQQKIDWGHGYPEYAVRVAQEADVAQVALFHHSPDASDEDMDAIAARWAGHTRPKVFPAQEGLVVDLSG